MPTEAEINSIYNTSTGTFATGVAWDWISDTATYGTVGFEVYVTSDSSKKIFLPLAGYWSDVLRYSECSYWSYKFNASDRAYGIYIDNMDHKSWNTYVRYCGQPVRPVHN